MRTITFVAVLVVFATCVCAVKPDKDPRPSLAPDGAHDPMAHETHMLMALHAPEEAVESDPKLIEKYLDNTCDKFRANVCLKCGGGARCCSDYNCPFGMCGPNSLWKKKSDMKCDEKAVGRCLEDAGNKANGAQCCLKFQCPLHVCDYRQPTHQPVDFLYTTPGSPADHKEIIPGQEKEDDVCTSPQIAVDPAGAPVATPELKSDVYLYKESGYPAPKKVKNVPFASKTAKYWPLDAEMSETAVCYRNSNGSIHWEPKADIPSKPTGSTCYTREFMASRGGGKRLHSGVDLYAKVGTKVIATESGKVVNRYKFYENVCCVIVQTDAGAVINYGEVDCKTIKVKKGDTVVAGQHIAQVGDLKCCHAMLHFEMYTKGVTANIKSLTKPSSKLYNPVEYLLHALEFGLRYKNKPATATIPLTVSHAGVTANQAAPSSTATAAAASPTTATPAASSSPPSASTTPSHKGTAGHKVVAKASKVGAHSGATGATGTKKPHTP
jgi:biotin carboxyl carrier protein